MQFCGIQLGKTMLQRVFLGGAGLQGPRWSSHVREGMLALRGTSAAESRANSNCLDRSPESAAPPNMCAAQECATPSGWVLLAASLVSKARPPTLALLKRHPRASSRPRIDILQSKILSLPAPCAIYHSAGIVESSE